MTATQGSAINAPPKLPRGKVMCNVLHHLLAELGPQSTAAPQSLLPQQHGNSYGSNLQQPVCPQQPVESSLEVMPAIGPLTAQEGNPTQVMAAAPLAASPFDHQVSCGH